MIPFNCEPRSKNEVVLEYLEGPDKQRKYHYCLYWQTDYIPGHPNPKPVMVRGQHFFADPAEDLKRPHIREVDHRLKR